ncbi:MAG: BatA domain-containing protein, partial [Taibaiella sp.]|nr:BatA domain-containing protein [Taibaiella sp.]
MSFLYPLFLIAGLALAIPVLIHLFNLRRYKTVYFPHTRFLKNIQLRSQKQSQLRYKWLLALRLLFLAMLILAFAQPFFAGADKKDTGHRLQAIYIDNSASMGLKKESQRLVDLAREAARRQVRNAPPGTRFVLLTNDRPV